MRRNIALVVIAAVLSAGCFSVSKSTSPSTTSSLGGTWTTFQSLPGTGSIQESCTNFRWAVTEFSGSTASGTFSATCLGNMQIAGSARGTLSGSTINWSANATATVPGLPPCDIALSGTATLETNQIRIPYSGTTCLGPVSGTEILRK